MIGLLSLILLDFACVNMQWPDQNSMCVALTAQDERIAQCNSDNLQLMGKVAQLEKFILKGIEATPAPTPGATPTP